MLAGEIAPLRKSIAILSVFLYTAFLSSLSFGCHFAYYYPSLYYALQNFIYSPFTVLSGCFLLLLQQPYNEPFGICCCGENPYIGLCGREFTILEELFA